MNLIDCTNTLFQYFMQNDYLCFPNDFSKLKLVSDTPEYDTFAFKEALKEFVNTNLVKHIEFKEQDGKKIIDKDLYILIKPFGLIDKTLSISSELCAVISATINNYLAAKNDRALSDPTKIGERDIENLLIIIDQMLKQNKQSPVL